jgi:hypothetical protein
VDDVSGTTVAGRTEAFSADLATRSVRPSKWRQRWLSRRCRTKVPEPGFSDAPHGTARAVPRGHGLLPVPVATDARPTGASTGTSTGAYCSNQNDVVPSGTFKARESRDKTWGICLGLYNQPATVPAACDNSGSLRQFRCRNDERAVSRTSERDVTPSNSHAGTLSRRVVSSETKFRLARLTRNAPTDGAGG